jgi:hypothetical protein
MKSVPALIVGVVALLQSSAAVLLDRIPDGGIQPQLALDRDGTVHLIYFKGDAMGGDIFYVRRPPNDSQFSAPLRVNRTSGGAIAAGTMRGPQMALGKNNRVHVSWMGGNGAKKVQIAEQPVTPMFYTRLNDKRTEFEPERNLITYAGGLDGGGSVAADPGENVYVVWHGAPPGSEGEENRALYIARSTDEGKSFAREHKVETKPIGACACCGLKAFADESGKLHVLFRAAESGVNRNELWLRSADFGATFETLGNDPWRIAACPASGTFLAGNSQRMLGVWETENGVRAGLLESGKLQPIALPRSATKQKHPHATYSKDEVLITWVEGAGWGSEGKLAWQLFTSEGQPASEKKLKEGVPPWSFAACYAKRNGDFVLLY